MKLTCPAKVNLALSVGPPDPQTGYHPIASWMVALDWGDELTLERRPDHAPTTFDRAWLPAHAGPEARSDEGPGFRNQTPRVPGPTDPSPPASPIDWPLDHDLAFRAHALLEAHLGRSLPVHATLRKRIPAGAGLGGGSGDAAAMLVGLNTLFDLRLTPDALLALAPRLGSDVAFPVAALLGTPSALVTGFGERLEPLPLPDHGPLHLVLILPPLHCPTPAVYRAFDAMLVHAGPGEHRTEAPGGGDETPKSAPRHQPTTTDQPSPDAGCSGRPSPDAARIRHLATSPLDPTALFNDLAEPAMRTAPALREIRARLAALPPEVLPPEAPPGAPPEHAAHNELAVHVTGSGAALFCLTRTRAAAQALAHRITTALALPTVVATTLR